jgi:hypothetical protein
MASASGKGRAPSSAFNIYSDIPSHQSLSEDVMFE